MALSPYLHELLSILSLGFGTMFMLSGYNTQAFIVQSVLHSVNKRESETIDQYAGYYGTSAMYGTYTLATLVGPWICYRLGTKWTLFVGSIMFTIYLFGFFFLNSWFYYFSAAIMGIGFALYYVGQGMYMAEHSTRNTLTRNSVLITVVGQSSMLFGGIVLMIIFTINSSGTAILALESNKTTVHDVHADGQFERKYRYFQTSEILIIYGSLLVCSIISNVIFACMPVDQHDSLAQQDPVKRCTITSQFSHMWTTFTEPRILLLVPLFLFYGLHVAFWLSVFPTTFAFTKCLAGNPMLPAFYSAAVGVGNIICGSYIQLISRWKSSFGLVPTMLTQIVLAILTYALTLALTPNEATIQPTEIDAPIWQPNTFTCILFGLLHGMVDCCSNTMRSLILTLAVPRKRLQAYSIAKLFQSLSTCLGTFLSPRLTIAAWILLLGGVQVSSSTGFYFVSRRIQMEEKRKIHDENGNQEKIAI